MIDEPLLDNKLAKKNKALKRNIKESKKLYGKKKPMLGKVFKALAIDDVDKITNEVNDLLEIVRKKNIKGYSGDEYPTISKLEKIKNYNGKRILVVNAIECEPGLVHDNLLVGKYLDDIKKGILMLKSCLELSECYLAIKKTNEEDLLDEICHTRYLDFVYPLGEEHKLIKALLDIDVEGYPVDKGILVLNVQTVYQINRLVEGSFDGGKFITIGNLENGEGRAIYVHNNDKIVDIVSGYYGDTNLSIYAGKGLLRAHKINRDEVIDDSISFICLSNTNSSNIEKKCKGCGKCSRNCPQGLDVKKIVRLREKDKDANIDSFNPDKCLKCGLCVWNCPAKKNIIEYLQ